VVLECYYQGKVIKVIIAAAVAVANHRCVGLMLLFTVFLNTTALRYAICQRVYGNANFLPKNTPKTV
jgi:hypothetical protein